MARMPKTPAPNIGDSAMPREVTSSTRHKLPAEKPPVAPPAIKAHPSMKNPEMPSVGGAVVKQPKQRPVSSRMREMNGM